MRPDAPDPQAPWTIVTGAAGGIGLAVTRMALAQGRRVLALDCDVAALRDLAADALVTMQIDVADEDKLKSAIDAAAMQAPVAALVCCAAIFPAAPLEGITTASWDAVFRVNVEGSLFACQAVLPHMRSAGAGSIVLFSSTMARTGGVGAAHYAASKGAILGLARSLALDVAGAGIRVNTVSPGLTDTAQPRGNMSADVMFERAARTPMGRIGEAHEMADAVSFLLSDDASFITGQDLRITGGSGLF